MTDTITTESRPGSDGRRWHRWVCRSCGAVGVWLWHLERATRNGAGHPQWCQEQQEAAR